MKIVAKTVLSGSTSILILSGTFSWLGMFLIGWGSLIIYQSLLDKVTKRSILN